MSVSNWYSARFNSNVAKANVWSVLFQQWLLIMASASVECCFSLGYSSSAQYQISCTRSWHPSLPRSNFPRQSLFDGSSTKTPAAAAAAKAQWTDCCIHRIAALTLLDPPALPTLKVFTKQLPAGQTWVQLKVRWRWEPWCVEISQVPRLVFTTILLKLLFRRFS